MRAVDYPSLPLIWCGRLFRKPAAALMLLAALGLGGCVSHPRVSASARLRGGAPSQEELAQAVLQAIARQDLQAMKDLALSKEEFERYVWPELPVSNPRTNVSLDFVWSDVHFRSALRMQAIFDNLKGKKLSLVRLHPRRKAESFATHRAYPDMEVILRSEDGKEGPYPLFGTLIEMDGVWKVYSYAPYD
jgi:hypothetical protein